MKNSIFILAWLTIASFFAPSNTLALTMDDFKVICESTKGPCTENPILQAYVGGSLDLIAALDEETEYLQKIYCKDPRDLFDVKKIIEFMGLHQAEYAKSNSMLLVIRYLEENSGC